VADSFNLERARHHVLPRGVRKVRVNLYLDDDVVAYFKARAAQPHAAPYQTQINQMLRGAMKGAQAAGLTARQSNASDVQAALLSDERFIKAAAAQVAQVRPAPKGKRRRAA
jgi:hypothetical protein